MRKHWMVAAVFLLATVTFGQDGLDCTDADCHGGLLEVEAVHPAALDGGCVMCHESTGEEHEFGPLPDPVAELCLACHDDPRDGVSSEHAPAAEGECTSCHSPHGSDQAYYLPAETVDLCTMCHDDIGERLTAEYVHEVAREPGCVMCHNPHGSTAELLLATPTNELCMSCHEDSIALFGGLRGHPTRKHPVAGAPDPKRSGRSMTCGSCHDPHGSGFRSLLIGASGYHSCRRCHDH